MNEWLEWLMLWAGLLVLAWVIWKLVFWKSKGPDDDEKHFGW